MKKNLLQTHTQFFNFDMEISYSFKLSLIFQRQRQMAKIYVFIYREREKPSFRMKDKSLHIYVGKYVKGKQFTNIFYRFLVAFFVIQWNG